jgi:hypothetical protein
VGGRLSTARRNRIVGNLFVDHAQPVALSDPENESDYNVFSAGGPFDLARRQAKGWDKHSIVVALTLQFDPETLTLTGSAEGPLSPPVRVPGIEYDYFGKRRNDAAVLAGPFAAFPLTPVRLWPEEDH